MTPGIHVNLFIIYNKLDKVGKLSKKPLREIQLEFMNMNRTFAGDF